MKKFKNIFVLFALLLSSAAAHGQVIEVDMAQRCHDEFQNKTKGLDCDQIPPYEIDKVDTEGKHWKIRLFFGFSRTNYMPTDLHIKSGVMTTVVRDVVMHERTSALNYNPKNWNHIDESLKWIDEPTNTFMLSLEYGKNNFYITVFHPKYLKSVLYKTTEVDGVKQYEFAPIGESDDFSQNIPEGYNMLYLGNTHKNMIWQVGYGRQFNIMNSKKWGKLTYIPKADVGINTGKARSVHIIRGERWDDYIDDVRIQGWSVSAGHRIEYTRGTVSVFLDHRIIYSKLKHGFYDGTVEYTLKETPLTFGLGIDLFNRSKRRGQ